MTARDVRDAVLGAWEDLLRPHFGIHDARVLANELAVIAEGHGVRLTAPTHLDDPNADWTRPVEPGAPGGDYRAARARLAATTEPEGT